MMSWFIRFDWNAVRVFSRVGMRACTAGRDEATHGRARRDRPFPACHVAPNRSRARRRTDGQMSVWLAIPSLRIGSTWCSGCAAMRVEWCRVERACVCVLLQGGRTWARMRWFVAACDAGEDSPASQGSSRASFVLCSVGMQVKWLRRWACVFVGVGEDKMDHLVAPTTLEQDQSRNWQSFNQDG